ncbi:MAG: hypothetical protein VR65_18830 [Desulfobulbaceae bacterium BRH_c16a]|nr:MAG: hypothetical protein VR65_18830 [Desulfobulbaceae bacterium BRH_c16a]
MNYKDALAVINTAWARLLVCCYSVVKDRSGSFIQQKSPAVQSRREQRRYYEQVALSISFYSFFLSLSFGFLPADLAVGSSSPHRQEAANYLIALDQSRGIFIGKSDFLSQSQLELLRLVFILLLFR